MSQLDPSDQRERVFEPSDSSQWLAALPPYVEIDAGTERLQSTKDLDSLERKARIYEHQAQCYREFRYRVLFLALRGSRRVSQFLDLAAQQQSDPNRTIFYGAYLNDYLQSPDRLFSQLFRTPGSQTVSLLPRKLAPKTLAVS